MHPDLVRLMVIAAIQTHRSGGKFEKPGQFPNLELTDLPVDPDADAYMRQILGGRTDLDRYLPFWLAAIIDRYLLFVLPCCLLSCPCSAAARRRSSGTCASASSVGTGSSTR